MKNTIYQIICEHGEISCPRLVREMKTSYKNIEKHIKELESEKLIGASNKNELVHFRPL